MTLTATYSDCRKILRTARQHAKLAEQILLQYPDAAGVAKLVSILIIDAWKELITYRAAIGESASSRSTEAQILIDVKDFAEVSGDDWKDTVKKLSTFSKEGASQSEKAFLTTQLQLLRREIRRAHTHCRAHFGITNPLRGLAVKTLYLALAVAVCVGLYSLLRPPPVWRILFFDTTTTIGDPTGSLYSNSVNFDWTFTSPVKGIKDSYYSARLESCLQVEQEQEIFFNLGSDDGSRLFVDKQIILDKWKPTPFSMSTVSRKFPAGYYHLKVDFFQNGGSSELKLTMTRNGKRLTEADGVRLLSFYDYDKCKALSSEPIQ